MAGFDNDTMYANNVDFSGGSPVTGKVTADGELLIGSTASPNIRVGTLTAGTGIQVNNSSGGIEIVNTAPSSGGTVTDVTGTADRITSTGGTTPQIDIAATYVGQTSITTLGTIATGTWNGTVVAEAYGGTNQNTYTTGDILYASAANTLSKLAAGTAGDVLTSNGAGVAPSYQTPTAGTVTSVSGTADRITSTGGATPVIDIAATYVGQTSITTLGTIATGTWEATDVGVAHGGTGRSTATAYAVLCGGTTATGAHQSIADVGTSGQVLTSNGAGALPTFQDAAGGGSGWVFLATATAATSSSLDFASSIDSTYFLYAFVIESLVPVTDNAAIWLRTSADGGSSYDSGASNYNGNIQNGFNGSDTKIVLSDGVGTNSGEHVNGIVYMFNPSDTVFTNFTFLGGSLDSTSSARGHYGWAQRSSAAAVNAIRFLAATGNLESGTIKLYGCATPS